MTAPKRTDTHRIDTHAVRTLMQHLPEDWLVRSLEERDYGVDLQVEVFKGDTPSGHVAMIQVKGKRDSFGHGSVSLSGFPVRTIEYALLFQAPFFVFHTSVADKKTYFIWLQKYADTKLLKTTKEWRTQDSVTLYFPENNLLETNSAKIENILARNALMKDAFLYFGFVEELQRAIDQIEDGNLDFVGLALEQVRLIQTLDPELFEQYAGASQELDFNLLRSTLEDLDEDNIDQALALLADQLSKTQSFRGTILATPNIDQFIVDNASTDAHPY